MMVNEFGIFVVGGVCYCLYLMYFFWNLNGCL